MFSHAPLTNVSMFVTAYMGFVWKASCFCPKVELLSHVRVTSILPAFGTRGRHLC